MNRLVKAQLALETRRAELGKLLDLEERGEDYQGKLDAAKAAITAAQVDLDTASKAEPEVPEHRQTTPEGAELRALEERASVGGIVRLCAIARPTPGSHGGTAATFEVAVEPNPAFPDSRL